MKDELASARIAITGAGGVVGSRLLRRLAEAGAKVTAIDLREPVRGTEIDGVRYVVADVADADRLQAQLAGMDVVYHLAFLMGEEANADPVAAARINALGGANVLQACLEAKVGRLLLASSISVFGSTRDYSKSELPLGDCAPKLGSKGISVYSAGKIYLELLAEHYSRRNGLLVGGLRPGAVIGCSRTSGRAKTVANIVATAVRERRVSVRNGKAAFVAIHIDDVVGAFIALASADPGVLRDQPFFNLGGDYATVRSFCDQVAKILPDVDFEILDGDSDELFGTTPFVRDDGIHSMIGYRRRYVSLQAAINAEVAKLTAQSSDQTSG